MDALSGPVAAVSQRVTFPKSLERLAGGGTVSHVRRFIPKRLRCREFIAVTLQKIIETGGNKTDANAVWLVTDQVPRGTSFAELDRRWPFSRRSVSGHDVLRPEIDVMAVGSTNQRGDPSHAHPS
jgi:hypothetical protein